MSGHSKWATIKRKKAATDSRRGKLFAKLIRAIEVAARQGGGDPNSNATLAAAVAKARLQKWDYLDAVERARAAYLTLVSAADDIGVSSARLAAARTRLPASQIRKYVCRPRQLVERVPQQRI